MLIRCTPMYEPRPGYPLMLLLGPHGEGWRLDML